MMDGNWHLQKEEILLLMSAYCGEGECVVSYMPAHSDFPLKEEGQVKMEGLCDMHEPPPNEDDIIFNVCIKLQVQNEFKQTIDAQVSFSLPKLYPNTEVPVISISSDLVIEEDLSHLIKRAHSLSETLFPQPCLLEILAEIKDGITGMRLRGPIHQPERANVQSTPATNQTGSPLKHKVLQYMLVAKLDHMRSEHKYFKLLHSWAKELEMSGKVLKLPGRQGTYVVVFGERVNVAEFLRRWRTQNVDVDSRGRPCKEKLLSILCQEPIEGINDDGCAGLVFVECAKMCEIHAQFSNKEVDLVLNKVIPT